MPADYKDEDEDEEIALPSDTLALLQSFLTEKAEAEKRFEALRENAHKEADSAAERRRIEVTMEDFKEDWQLSQFWYSDETAFHLAIHSIAATPEGGSLGCVSSPTVFVEMMKSELPKPINPYVFEFDKRFAVFGSQFIFFDFNTPTTFNEPLQHKFHTLVVDPPFLSDECWSKTAECVRFLAIEEGCKIIVCTGLVMREKIQKELGCKLTSFQVKHKGGLSNEFGCYTNFESDGFKWVGK
ncbi:putative N6-adenine methyltransferase-domain-containing protein [Obelidium mucronatum]|nr:putative N6-adenine methyltransferase-domain-containing protein [Obelidium mucronatum]